MTRLYIRLKEDINFHQSHSFHETNYNGLPPKIPINFRNSFTLIGKLFLSVPFIRNRQRNAFIKKDVSLTLLPWLYFLCEKRPSNLINGNVLSSVLSQIIHIDVLIDYEIAIKRGERGAPTIRYKLISSRRKKILLFEIWISWKSVKIVVELEELQHYFHSNYFSCKVGGCCKEEHEEISMPDKELLFRKLKFFGIWGDWMM